MAENDIKQKIVLEGEKQYRQALKDANRELKTLKSELKAETAELGKNATEQQKNEVRIKNLKKQIQEQQKVVKTYTEALKEVREKYADNQDEIAKWEQKLNNARATLANMQNDLQGVNDSFKEMQGDANMATVATKSLADTFGSLADAGGSIADTIQGIFTGMVTTVRDRITEIWADVIDLAARSNNLVDLAGFWNTDVMTIQKYAGAVSEVSGNLEDLNSLVTKINFADAKKITELTNVSSTNYKDQWEYAMAVMEQMSQMDTETRNKVGKEIFGKSATKAFDLLNDWDKLLDKLDKYDPAKEGYGLTEEELKNMSDIYDKVNGLKQSWQFLQDMATVKLLGDLTIDLTGNAQGILDGFLAYFNADTDAEREAAIKQVEDNILGMFEAAKQAILDGIALLDQIAEDLKNSDNPTANALGNLLGGLVDALQWLTEDNMTNVVRALEILAGFWLTGRGLQMGGKIAKIVADIMTIKAFSMGGGAAGLANGAVSAASGAATAGAASMSDIVSSAIVSSSGSVATAIVNALTSVVGGIGVGVLSLGPVVERLLRGEDPNIQEYKEKAEEVIDALNEAGMEPTPEMKKDATHAFMEAILTGKSPTYDKYTEDQLRRKEEQLDPTANWPQARIETTGPSSPVHSARFDITDAQKAAVEAVWDALRSGNDDAFDNAYDEMEAAFEDNKETFDRLDGWLDKLWEQYNSNKTDNDFKPELWNDIPAQWWKNPDNGGDGITNDNISKFNSLPGNIEKAVAKAVAGIRVSMDGRTVGQLVAQYVSEQIAESIV